MEDSRFSNSQNKRFLNQDMLILFDLPDSFISYNNFLKIIENISNSIQNIILDKIQKYEAKVALENRIFVVFVITSVFKNVSKLSPQNTTDLLSLMSDNHDRNSYIQYQFMAHQIFSKIKHPKTISEMSVRQMSILKIYSFKAFEEEKKKQKRNIFLMYMLLRFSTRCRSVNRDFLSSHLSKSELLNEEEFWQQIFKFMVKFVYSEPNNQSKTQGKDLPEFLLKIEQFFERNPKANKTEIRSTAKKQSFEATSGFITSVGLDFKVSAQMLFFLSDKYHIGVDRVEEILKKNRHICKEQINRKDNKFATVADLKRKFTSNKTDDFKQQYADHFQQIRLSLIFDRGAETKTNKRKWMSVYWVIKFCIPYLTGKNCNCETDPVYLL